MESKPTSKSESERVNDVELLTSKLMTALKEHLGIDICSEPTDVLKIQNTSNEYIVDLISEIVFLFIFQNGGGYGTKNF